MNNATLCVACDPAACRAPREPVPCPTVRWRDEDHVACEFDGCQVGGRAVGEIAGACLQLPEVRDLNPGSDYTEQYFDVEFTADSVTFVFRRERQ